MNILVIVDNQDPPGLYGFLDGHMAGFGVEVKDVVVGNIGHESALTNGKIPAGYKSTF